MQSSPVPAPIPAPVPSPDDAQRRWQDADGRYYSFDGVFYNFANSDGRGIKLWTPPGEEPIRGVLLHGNPGGGLGGDTRTKALQRDLQEFAARHHFGVAGVTGFPGRETYGNLAQIVLDTFTAWGRAGLHPELEYVPFLCTGGSNAGMFSFGMLCHAPERIIAITPNCGPRYFGQVTPAVLEVPAWMHIGLIDPLVPRGVEDTEELFATHLPDGGWWAWEAEIKGHENGSSDHVDFAYWDAIIPLRLPATTGRDGPVPLRRLARETGWWVDFRSWDHVLVKVGPETEAKPQAGEKGRYGWVPNESIARIYQAAATRQRIVSLQFAQSLEVAGGMTSGVYLSSGGSRIARAGETIQLKLTVGDMVWGLGRVSIHDQAEKLGEFDFQTTDTFSFTVDGRKRVYALYALCEYREVPRISNPLQVVVADDECSARIDHDLHRVSYLARYRTLARKNSDRDLLQGGAELMKSLPAASLGAFPLTPQEEAMLQQDGRIAARWEQQPSLRLDEALGNQPDRHESMEVRVQYGDKGLYLYFLVHDAHLSEKPAFDFSGMIDFHLASVGLPALQKAEASPEVYTHALVYSLLCRAMQWQIPMAGREPSPPLYFNCWNPWSDERVRLPSATAYEGTGAWVEVLLLSPDTRAGELFLPWAMVGHPGLPGRPPAGSSLACQISYNAVTNDAKLSWPFGLQPWSTPARDPTTGGPVRPVFGQIVFLE